MPDQRRGPGRERMPLLAQFLASPASTTIKQAVQAILPRLARYPELDEAALIAADSHLLAQMLALTPAGLDFFRLLRGERPVAARYARSHVSAALRAKRRALGRPPSVSDFPVGHYVPVLADLYWGGVAAWAAAAPSRAQKPKGHWQVRANQIAALQAFAAANPDSSITQATLRGAGLHALATALDAAALARVVRQAGLTRKLRCREAGFWQAEQLIAAYVALCEAAGLPLSTHMLMTVGGQGFTIRSSVGKVFGTFHAFRVAVGERHPWLKPKARPTTSDGTRLDSWQEVAVYERLRRTLPPDTRIVPHVLLSEALPNCSADFLVGDRVYVEVLMIARTDMEAPQSRTQRQYAAKWQRKATWYAAGKAPLVVIEPDDVLAAHRLTAKVDEVLALLGTATPPRDADDSGSSAAVARSVHPKGYWTIDALSQVVAEVARQVGGFPTHAELIAAGYPSAPTMLTRLGRARVAERIGVPLRHCKGVWSKERVEREAADWVNEHGRFPSIADLKGTGHNLLAGARQRFFNGETDALRQAAERLCGRPLARRKAPNGSYATQERLAALLRPLCTRLGRFPTRAEVRAAELSPAIWAKVSVQFGVRSMAAFMQVPYAGPQRQRGRRDSGSVSHKPDLFHRPDAGSLEHGT